MSQDTKGFVITKNKNIDGIIKIVTSVIEKIDSLYRCSPKDGKMFRVFFADGKDQRVLFVFLDCDCDNQEIGNEKIIFSLGYWGNSVEIMKKVLEAFKDYGVCYLQENDCYCDPEIFSSPKDVLREYQYNKTVESISDMLCGYSCGTSADAIIEYCKRPDISLSQVERIIQELSLISDRNKD